jgi:hypothetical protein
LSSLNEYSSTTYKKFEIFSNNSGRGVLSKWVSRGIRDRYFFVGIIHARRDIEARVGILTGRIC